MCKLCLVILLSACAAAVSAAQQTSADSHFDGNSWWAHVKFLADDSLEGRDTGSEGLRKAQAYAVEQLQKAGLEPAGSNGFYQPVRFNQHEVDETKSSLALVTNGQAKALSFADDAFIGTRATHASVSLSAPLVFVGYGLQISEKNLDELAGLDLKGKIVVYLVGSPSDIPTALASHYQTAAERWKSLRAAGVLGTITIMNPASMDIPWSRISVNRNHPSMDLADDEFNETPSQQLGVTFNPPSAEEKGLLGSKYFATHPTVAAKSIVADVNVDMFLPIVPLKILKIEGIEESDLGTRAAAIAQSMGIKPIPDPEPLRNAFIRSDQYSFIKKGVPAVKVDVGFELGTPEQKIFKDWLTNRYHAPSDDVNQPVDLKAAAGYEEFTRRLLLETANTPERPRWKTESFFRRYAADQISTLDPRRPQMGRAVVHFEIGCQNSAKTQEFYEKLFDWKIEAMGPAAMIAAESGGIGGHITALGHEPNHYTMFYVDVDDVVAYLERAKALGGKTLVPPVEIPTGTFAWMQDPEGNTVGLWKAKK